MRAFHPGRPNPALHGISAEVIAELCKVHVTTARRWKRGEEPPFSALQIVSLYANGELTVVDPKWHQWRLRNGLLVSPDGHEFSTGDVQAIPFWKSLIAEYQALQRCPMQSDWISERWEASPELEVANVA